MVSLTLENDLFYGNDRHYTSGAMVIWTPAPDTPAPAPIVSLARLAPWFPAQGEVRHGYAVGQSMFTPSDITVANPPLDDRPYAGWLYGAIGLGVASGKQVDMFGLSIGMVGPDSYAEQSQKFIHELVGSDIPQGWSTQLKNELGVVVTYQRSLREYATTTLLGRKFDVTPHAGMALGNVFTYVNTGFTIRYGRNLPDDYGPARVQPGLPGYPDFSPVADFGWYVFAGAEGRAVARNIFLNGNSFGDSRSVDKIPFVGDLQFGVVFDWPDMRLSYTHVLRSREFRTQDSADDFGALSLSVKF